MPCPNPSMWSPTDPLVPSGGEGAGLQRLEVPPGPRPRPPEDGGGAHPSHCSTGLGGPGPCSASWVPHRLGAALEPPPIGPHSPHSPQSLHSSRVGVPEHVPSSPLHVETSPEAYPVHLGVKGSSGKSHSQPQGHAPACPTHLRGLLLTAWWGWTQGGSKGLSALAAKAPGGVQTPCSQTLVTHLPTYCFPGGPGSEDRLGPHITPD